MNQIREKVRRAKLAVFSRREAGEPEEFAKATWKHLFTFSSKEHLTTLLLAIAGTIVSSGLRTFKAVAYGRIFNIIAEFGAGKIYGQEALNQVSTWSLALAGMGIGTWVSHTLFMSMWMVFGEEQARSVRREVFGSLLKKDMAWYDGQTDGTSSLLVRIETQTRELQLATSQPFGLILCEFLIALGSIILALYSSWELTLVLLASLPISFAIMTYVSRPLEPAIQAQKKCLAEASKLSTASLTGIDLVKIFNGFDTEIWQYAAVMKKVTSKYLVQARCNAMQMGYVEFWLIMVFALGFWYGSSLVDDGLSPGAVFTTFCATFAAFEGVDAIMPQFMVLSKGMVAGQSLKSLVSKPEEEDGRNGSHCQYRPAKCVGDIDLRGVSFAYPANPLKAVLEQSTFSFPAGELTFLVGRSGSGKSTISNLILRFYDTLTGEVRIDGHHIRSLDPAWIRSNITLIQQSSILFDDTFYRNVAFGLKDPDKATAEEVRSACEVALLQSTIASLPDGVETMVGSGGYSLSGGQKQRLALARARLRDPPVLILDEVTSGLDHISRTLIMEVIRDWRKGKTTIIITHDVAQIEDADYVYVMDKGKVVQEGYRGHLMRDEDAMFASLVKSAADYEPPADGELAEDLPQPPEAEEVTEPAPSKQRASFFEILGDGLLSQPGIPKGTSLGGQFVRATRMRETQLWQVDEQAESAGDVEGYSQQLKTDLLGHASEMRLGATSDKYEAYEVHSQVSSCRDPRDSSFDLVEQVGKSIQASRLEDSEVRYQHRRSGVLSVGSVVEPDDGILSTTGSGSPYGTDKYGENTSITTILKTVWPNLIVSQRILFICGLVACLIAATAIPVFSYLLTRLLASFWDVSDRAAAGQKWAIMLLGVAVVNGFANFLSRYLMEYTGQSWINTLRVEALKRILKQSKAWFDTSGNTVGKINECLDRNAEEMRNLVGRFLPSIIIVVAMISAAMIWAMVVSWKLTLVALSPAPVVIGSIKASAYFTGKSEASCNESSEKASAIARQSFLNVRVVRALTLENYFSRKYEEEVIRTFSLGFRRSLYAGFFYGFQEAMNLFIAALIFYYGIQIISSKDLAVDAVLQVMNLLIFAIGTSSSIMGTIPQIAAARTTGIQMLNYANLPPSPPRETEGGKKVTTPFPISFNGLSFAYPSRPKQEVLRNFRLRLEAGTSTAIVGPSGCGKSTLASLILGLYSPSMRPFRASTASATHRDSRGESAPGGYGTPDLSFGAIPWNEVDVPHLRSMMSYVPQTPFLFPGSIAANIAYGIPQNHPLAQTPNIETAARAAGIHSFIQTLPEGYATLVGDGGLALSGGQAQRVCIARAVARWPRVLVLDEPTSALDARSAEAVREAIRGLVEGARERMGVVVVTHCREMMKVMGRVVLVEGGFVAEEGGYEELLEKKGRFARLVRGVSDLYIKG